uniref:Uncharacterized protein n=1 Tax=Fagus sylvatica TaxID=28930 RepID=A0A2N9I2J5_FAGSY
MVIPIRHPLLLLLLHTLDPPSHSPQINWKTSSPRLLSRLVMHPLLLLFLSCLLNLVIRIILDYFGCVVQDPKTGQELGTGCKIVAKAIVRNPSLLTYDFHNIFKLAIAMYDEMGVSGQDLIPMLLSWPTMIPRTSFDEEKMEYIRKTGISKESKMYKYVVTLIGVSRHETIRLKVANLEKFGFSNDEIFNLFGRSPLMLTLSVDKVQRNMTFILGMMKFPASVVLQYPFLLYSNLEAVLRPRVLLARKIQDMGLDLQIKGPKMMTEKRFLEAFVKCHPRDVADELMAFYTSAKASSDWQKPQRKIILQDSLSEVLLTTYYQVLCFDP